MSKKVQVWIGIKAKGSSSAKVILFKLIESRGAGWHPVTGWVEKGEAFFLAAQREMEEETQISPKSGDWVDLAYSHYFEGRWGKAEEHAFGFILNEQALTIHLDPSEMTEFKWVSIEDAQKEVAFAPQKHALELFSCYLK